MKPTTLLTILLTTITLTAQIPTADIRVVEHNGQYGPTPGIWGNVPLTNSTTGEIRFAVNDRFYVRTEPRANVSTNIVADVSWSTNGPAIQRIMSVGVNIANVGGAALNFGSAFNEPGNYYSWGYGRGWPGVKNLFLLELRDTNGVNVIHSFPIHATLTWFNRPAIPGPVYKEFGPWWQGLEPGHASQTGLDPDIWNAVIDTSAVMDGLYRMRITARGGNSTERLVLIEALEVRVVGF